MTSIPRPRMKPQRRVSALSAVAALTLPLGLSAQSSNDIGNLVADQANTSYGANTGYAIGFTCATGLNGQGSALNQRFQQDCDNIVNGSLGGDSGVTQALNQVASEEINTRNSIAIRRAGARIGTLTSRLLTLRGAGLALEPLKDQHILLAANQVPAGASVANAINERLGVFATFAYGWGSQGNTFFDHGYDLALGHITAGMDYKLTPNLVLGGAFSYSDGQADYDKNGGRQDIQDLGFSLYGTYFLNNGLYFDGALSLGKTDYDLRRNIHYSIEGLSANQRAKSSTEGDAFSAFVSAGYDLAFRDWNLSPHLNLTYMKNKVDGYAERMLNLDLNSLGAAMAVAMDDTDYNSFTSALGATFSFSHSQSWGILTPQLSIDWIHEFQNDQQRTSGYFVNDINRQPFALLTQEPDRNYFDLGLSLAAQLPKGRAAFLSYNTLLGYEDLQHSVIRAGFRMEFD